MVENFVCVSSSAIETIVNLQLIINYRPQRSWAKVMFYRCL